MNTITIVSIAVFFAILSGSITAAVALSKIRAHRKSLNARRELLMNGIPAKAAVNSIAQSSSEMDGRPGVELDLTFTTKEGEVIRQVIVTYIPVTHLYQYQSGSIIDVRYRKEGNEIEVEAAEAYIR
ncbi:hypothetical protein EBB07_22680 [Paenibacillaceae bacterium]|nr:hypothetical protein EBB07_22680 [Paenibacillaceae bacterium]